MRFGFLVKILVTVLLCAFIVWKGDWEVIWEAVQNLNPLLILCVFVCMTLCVTISALKWQILLSIHGISFDFGKLHRYYFTAMFFNNFLPTNIGGDGYRIYKTMQNPHSKAAAVISVLTERITGIWALLVLGLVGGTILFMQGTATIPELGGLLGFFGVFVAVVPIFLMFSRRTVTWLLAKKTFPHKIRKVLERFGDYRHHTFRTLQVILLSFFFHLFTLSWMLILIKAIGATSSVVKLVVAVAISNMVALLPISINGIGLMDGSFICVAGKFGMNYESALMVMVLIRALLIPLSLIGGMLYLRDKRRLKYHDFRREGIKSNERALS